MPRQPFSPRVLSLAIIAACGINSPVKAQSEETAPGMTTTQIEEITVYAQRRAQSIQDVPITISAYNGDLLERIGIVELDALSDITPGLVIQEQSPNNPGFVIRGITSDSGSAQSSPRVSVYYNGVDVSRSRGSYFELYDIERVEVVKGPQATLFGTAASVGAVSIYTNTPHQETAGALTFSTGNYASQLARGFITGGNDMAQARLAFMYRKRDGFIDNIAGSSASQNPNGQRQNDMHAIERTAIRPSLRLTPTDALTIDLVYNYEKNDDSGTSFKNGRFAPTGGDTSPFSFVEMAGSPVSREVLGKSDLGVEREVHDINLRVEWQLSDTLAFTSITAGRSFDSLEIFDADGTQAWFLEFGEDAEGDQFSQEFRLVNTGERLTSIFGASYFTEDGSQRVPFSTEESVFLNCLGVFGPATPCINPDGSVPVLTPILTGGALQLLPYEAEFSNFGDNEILSAFADLTWLASTQLELTAGLRYIYEDKTSGFSALAPSGSIVPFPLLPVVSTGGRILEAGDTFDDFLPRFNALYRVHDELNVYATIAKGRRSEVLDVSSIIDAGGNVAADITEVPAEIVWNYEVGIKGFALDNRVSYSGSVFYQDYSDFQVTLQDEAGNFFSANAGAATNIGVEADIRAMLGGNLEIFTNLAWIDAEIDDDSNNGTLAGNRFRLQPEWTTSTGLLYSTGLTGDLNLTGSLVYSYRSDIFFEPENAPVAGLDIAEDSFSLVNLRVGIANERKGWALSLFANNVLDKQYLVDAGNTGGSFGNPTFVAGPPLFYGVELSLDFGS